MKYEAPVGKTIFDDAKIVGKSTRRIDGPLKTSGMAPYAYERHDVASGQVYGYIVGSAIAKGRIASMDLEEARSAPGVLAVIAATETDPLGSSNFNTAPLFGGPEITHYHQAIACVVAETFEQARAAAALIRTTYDRDEGEYSLSRTVEQAASDTSKIVSENVVRNGDFESAFAAAAVQIDQTYTTPDESHAMMEPFATIAAWEGDKLTLWTSNQMIAWGRAAMASILRMPKENIRLDSPYLGGGFGGKLWVRVDAVLAALAAKAAGRPVKIMMQRALTYNNATHRHATIQRVRIGADKNGKIAAIAHECWSGNLTGGMDENGAAQTRALYAGPDNLTASYLTELDLPEANAMRAPGEAPGHLAIEVAMDELAEQLGMDPIELRILNEPETLPSNPSIKFSDRHLVECLRVGAESFGWANRKSRPGTVREGRWMVGMGVAAGYRGALIMKSGARVSIDARGKISVETDMTDIGTGSYTIIAQTAAECMGVALEDVSVDLGDSRSPVSAGSGGQWGAASSTAGVYAACVELRRMVTEKFGYDPETASFADGMVRDANVVRALSEAGPLSAEDTMTYGDFQKEYDMGTYASHFAEVAVDAYTGEVRIRRMLAVCDAGRILNPLTARSQVIGAMVMAAGAALTEELAVDKRFGFFVNHDMAGYEVPVHADIGQQSVIFLDTLDGVIAPLKAKGVGELGICGPGAAIANAIYNATGVRVRDYPITVDKLIAEMPDVA